MLMIDVESKQRGVGDRQRISSSHPVSSHPNPSNPRHRLILPTLGLIVIVQCT